MPELYGLCKKPPSGGVRAGVGGLQAVLNVPCSCAIACGRDCNEGVGDEFAHSGGVCGAARRHGGVGRPRVGTILSPPPPASHAYPAPSRSAPGIDDDDGPFYDPSMVQARPLPPPPGGGGAQAADPVPPANMRYGRAAPVDPDNEIELLPPPPDYSIATVATGRRTMSCRRNPARGLYGPTLPFPQRVCPVHSRPSRTECGRP